MLLNTRIYLIVSISSEKQFKRFYQRAERALRAGIRILQLRCKNINDIIFLKIAEQFKSLTKAHKALLIINDRPDIAFACDADGVHLGQYDLAVVFAKNILGGNKIIGKSTHTLKQALQAQKDGADYIGFGPIFKTMTKPAFSAIGPEKIRQLVDKIDIPIFVLGGIDPSNIKDVISCGAKRIAVSNAILSRKDTEASITTLTKFFDNDPA